MCFADVIVALEEAGFPHIGRDRVYHAIRTGAIPKPTMNRSLQFQFEKSHVDALIAHFRRQREAGGKPTRRAAQSAAAVA